MRSTVDLAALSKIFRGWGILLLPLIRSSLLAKVIIRTGRHIGATTLSRDTGIQYESVRPSLQIFRKVGRYFNFRSPASASSSCSFRTGPVAQVPWSFHRFRYRLLPANDGIMLW